MQALNTWNEFALKDFETQILEAWSWQSNSKYNVACIANRISSANARAATNKHVMILRPCISGKSASRIKTLEYDSRTMWRDCWIIRIWLLCSETNRRYLVFRLQSMHYKWLPAMQRCIGYWQKEMHKWCRNKWDLHHWKMHHNSSQMHANNERIR